MLKRHRGCVCGFTLVELMVTIALLAILLALAAPSFSPWIRNAQVRTVTDSLQGGVRLAQAEAIRRHRQVVFFLTNQAGCDATLTADAGGSAWVIRTLPLMAGDPVEAVQCGQLADMSPNISIAGATALCFNSIGRQVANAAPSTFDVSASNADRPLRVLVTLGGSVKLCDPAKSLSASTPEGCPT